MKRPLLPIMMPEKGFRPFPTLHAVIEKQGATAPWLRVIKQFRDLDKALQSPIIQRGDAGLILTEPMPPAKKLQWITYEWVKEPGTKACTPRLSDDLFAAIANTGDLYLPDPRTSPADITPSNTLDYLFEDEPPTNDEVQEERADA